MLPNTPLRRRALFATAAILAPMAAGAQETPRTIPGLEDYALPGTPQPTPTPTFVPPPTSMPTPAPTSASPPVEPTPPVASAVTPAPRAVPRPAPTATPTPAPAAEPSPEPTLPPPTVPTPPPAPAETPAPAQAVKPEREEEGVSLWRIGGGLLAALAAFGAWRAFRRREHDEDEPFEVVEATMPPPPPPAPRAKLALDLKPLRAGVNMLTATVECEVEVANEGDAPAQGVRLGVALTSAHAGQDAELARLYAQPVTKPVAAPFALAPGETRRVRAVAAMPLDAIRRLEGAARPMFVPMVVANALYQAGDREAGQTARTFAVGIARADSPKLAPLRLDRPLSSNDRVAARRHAVAVER